MPGRQRTARQSKSANNTAHEGFNLFVTAVLEEALLEALARDGGFNQLRIDCTQGIQIVFFSPPPLSPVQDPGVTHLRLFTLWWIAFAIASGKGFLKDKAYVQFCSPAEALRKRQKARYRC